MTAHGSLRLVALVLAIGGMPIPAARAQDDAPKSFKPNSELEHSLVAATKDSSKTPDFISALLSNQLCLAADRTAAGELGVRTVRRHNGGRAMMLYTSAERAQEVFGKDSESICLPGDQLLESLRGQNVAINLGFDRGFDFSSDDLNMILGVSRAIDVASAPVLSAPDQIEEAAVEALRKALAPIADVTSAHLFLARWASTNEFAWYLDVRSRGTDQPVHDAIRDALRGVDLGGRPLDIVINAPLAPPTGGREIIVRN